MYVFINMPRFSRFRGFLKVMASIQRVKENAEVTNKVINELKSELQVVNHEYNKIFAMHLLEENAKLTAAVEEARNKLIQLEIKSGIKQISIPCTNAVTTSATPSSEVKTEIAAPEENKPSKPGKDAKPKKEKKAKEAKETPSELPVDIGRLDLRIGKIEDVQRHPDADSLYVLKINCGEDKPRTVCSGLVKHIPIENLKDRKVVILCNLKPVKMRGITSEAMVMCASSEAGVEVLDPPNDCQPGELIQCDGYVRQPDAIMNPKKKIFETVAPDLHTNENLEACYKNIALNVSGKGSCMAKSLKNVAVK